MVMEPTSTESDYSNNMLINYSANKVLELVAHAIDLMRRLTHLVYKVWGHQIYLYNQHAIIYSPTATK